MKRGKSSSRAARSERLAAALRENLKRRKEQARGRAGNAVLTDVVETKAAGTNASEGQSADPDFRRNRGAKERH